MSPKRWLLPKDPDLLGMLRSQAAITVEGMTDLVAWSKDDPGAADRVRASEHRADDAKRELWRALRDSFAPPLDTEDLYEMSADLDEVLNAAKDLVGECEIMGLAPDGPTQEMATMLRQAVSDLADAFGRLGTAAGDATECADAAIKNQRRIEHVYRRAMSELMSVDDLRDLIGRRELYRRLARLGGLVHAVADRVWYTVVKET